LNKLGGLGCFIAVALGALPACGGDDDKGAKEPFSSGVPGKPLSQLTDVEMKALCDSVGDYFVGDPAFVSGTCRFAGVGVAAASLIFGDRTDAELRASCSEIESACLQSEGTTTQEPGTCEKPDATCTATVAELEACITDSRDAFSGVLLSLPSCEALKRSDFGSPTSGGPATTTLPTPESCKTLEQKCPGAAAGAGVPNAAGDPGASGQ
jgi:hypothetical protein